MGLVKERQVIVTWFTPQEKIPKADEMVICTINGTAKGISFNNAIVILGWCIEEGWYSMEYDFEELDVIAWCDLEPYGGRINGGRINEGQKTMC